MPSLHLQTAWMPHEKPPPSTLPALPASPTLTNPDLVLPSTGMRVVSSPPRFIRRPPSPSYLRERPDESAPPRSTVPVTSRVPPIHHGMIEPMQRVLHSRDSRSSESARHRPASYSASDRSSIISSTSTLQEAQRLAPEPQHFLQPGQRSASGSSSSGLSGMLNFLSQYPVPEAKNDEDVYENGEGADLEQCDTATEMEAEADAQRQKQAVDEYNSAVLSKRAEKILANAKQRLNVMEGNLRGARDLVAPLTAANLKRAASLGSVPYPPVQADGYGYEFMRKPTLRTLQPQASSPAIGRDYQMHARGFSETELPERPYTALDHTTPAFERPARLPVHVHEPSLAQGLRCSKSYDALGAHVVSHNSPHQRASRSRHSRGSPDSALEPLHEDEEPRKYSPQPDGSIGSGSSHAWGVPRPSSQASDLREQMSNLKGRISSLKERAREESLKRQSLQSLRTSSPFSNALSGAPEGFYTSSSNYGMPTYDTNAGVGSTSIRSSPVTPRSAQYSRDAVRSSAGSSHSTIENAFPREQPTPQQSQPTDDPATTVRTPNSKFQIWPTPPSISGTWSSHSRNSSRVSNDQMRAHLRQRSNTSISEGIIEEDEFVDASPAAIDDNQPASSSSSSGTTSLAETNIAESERVTEGGDNQSVYEDATLEPGNVVAHEDREDAFDYGNFFLHSAMATYNVNPHGSEADNASISSAETTRGPDLVNTGKNHFTPGLEGFPLSNPETPERLRIIEANLHMRPVSSDSVSSFNTFATADEDRDTAPRHKHKRSVDWSSIPRPTSSSSHSNSRPNTAVKRPTKRDNSSERADSGVGLPRHSTGSPSSRRTQPLQPPRAVTPKQSTSSSVTGGILVGSPPTSPRNAQLQDPTSVAVHALLGTHGNQLGLRDNAVLFGLVESLRNVVRCLQEDDASQHETQLLRRRLEEAKLVLDGA